MPLSVRPTCEALPCGGRAAPEMFRGALPGLSSARLLALCGTAHFFVDCAGGALVAGISSCAALDANARWTWVVVYSLLAFGTQAVLGAAADRWRLQRAFGMLGCLLVASSLLSGRAVVVAVIAAGLGNALFHVGAGAICIQLAPGRCTGPGLFVAPGAIGLATGLLCGTAGPWLASIVGPLLVASAAAVAVLRTPPMHPHPAQVGGPNRAARLVLLLLLAAIAIRSLVGLAADFPWKIDASLVLGLSAAAAAGKACGGLLADRFGWLVVAVGAMLVSLPLLSLGAPWAITGIVGMFVFQMPMSVTLVAIARLFPGRPAFAFGLASLALIIGALPAFGPFTPVLGSARVTFVLILAAAAALLFGLRVWPR